MQSEKPSSFFWRPTALLILVCASFLALAPAGADAQQDPKEKASDASTKSSKDKSTPIKILYTGQLQDGNGDPISGVFPLTFKLYKHQLAAESIWQEQHFVAVVDGQYRLELGTRDVLVQEQLEGKRWIGVEFDTEGEILRDQLIVSIVDPTKPDGQQIAGSAAGSNRSSTFAEVAERANYAEHAALADRAEKLGDLDAETVEKLSNLALERLGEHLIDPDAHKGGKLGGKSPVSTERKLMDTRAGGRGGEAYKIHCPPGFVVTGIEGTAGRLVDSVQVVCSQIQ